MRVRSRKNVAGGLAWAFAGVVLLAALPAFARAAALRVPFERSVLVVLYHQVSDHPIVTAHGEDTRTKPFLSPAEFDAQLTQFAHDGYQTISLSTYEDFIAGKPVKLPAKPLLITFDDGFASAWTEATPVLRKHGMTAVMFVEGERVDHRTPGRLRRDDLTAMERSGIWRIESHGYAGHSTLRIDAAGTAPPYWYSNLAWLPEQKRLETRPEFLARLRKDFAAERLLVEGAVHHGVTAFAYPSDEYGENYPGHSNAPHLYPLIAQALREGGVEIAFATSVPAHYYASSRADDPYTLPRVGMGELTSVAFAESTDAGYADIPDLSRAGGYLDSRTIALAPDGGIWAAAAQRPDLFSLDLHGRELARWHVDALQSDRVEKPTLIAGLLATGERTLDVYLQRGVSAQGHPRLVTLAIDGSMAAVEHDQALPPEDNWLVGIARYHGKVVGLGSRGGVHDLRTGAVIARFAPASDPWTSRDRGRFAALCSLGDALVTFDRKNAAFVLLSADGTLRSFPYDGDPSIWSCAGTPRGDLLIDAFVNLHFSLGRVELEGRS